MKPTTESVSQDDVEGVDRVALYDYPLDGVRIATVPVEPRDAARLLVHDRRTVATRQGRVRELPGFLERGDLLVLNDTRVVPARLMARRSSGGVVEVLLHPTGATGSGGSGSSTAAAAPASAAIVLALLRPSARLKAGETLRFGGGGSEQALTILDPPGAELRRVRLGGGLAAALAAGELPLPPYLGRDHAEPADYERYQTIFAANPGAIAAPTAGLHFTPELFAELARHGIETTRLTLHVGPGTFLPVRTERLADHAMHEEVYEIPQAAADAIARAKERGRRVVAIGTTTTRALEAAASCGAVRPGRASTCLMIRPPHRFRVVDALLTNFHLPKTTLLALVAAFAGRERVLELYREAARDGYRFYSYGDAMLLL